MEFLNDKITSATGDTVSAINELKTRRGRQASPESGSRTLSSSTNIAAPAHLASQHQYQPRQLLATSHSMPFGGDFYKQSVDGSPAPPPIGFKREYLYPNLEKELTRIKRHQQLLPDHPDHQEQATNLNHGQEIQQHQQQQQEDLYQADTWTRLWFLRVMLLSLIRLFLFVCKLYEDLQATKHYKRSGLFGHFLITAASLLLPTIVFTMYRVSCYLQVYLASLRSSNGVSVPPGPVALSSEQQARLELRRAAAASPQGRLSLADADEGLVTARQSPATQTGGQPEETYHDVASSKRSSGRASRNSMAVPGVSAPALSSHALTELDKQLTDRVDRTNIKLAVGTSEELLKGILFIFWQLKRQVDVLSYLVERSCVWRKPSDTEKEELAELRTQGDGLEWFQDFYAAFLAILVQVYTLGLYWTISGPSERPSKAGTLFGAAGAAVMGSEATSGDGLAISNAAKTLGELLRSQVGLLEAKDLLIMSEVLVSSAVVVSLLVAVRRRDDGSLTLTLSMFGWGSLFAARIIVIALAFVHIGWPIMLQMVGLHVLLIGVWIYRIALDSHNGKASETSDQIWSRDDQLEMGQLAEADRRQPIGTSAQQTNTRQATQEWSLFEHLILMSQILVLFAIPSLFYWPIMFNLKLHFRPFKYLVLILTENFILVAIIWCTISASANSGQWYLLGASGLLSIAGFLFISLYVACKPTLTDYFARADHLLNEAKQAGVYYEFCSRIFKMPDLAANNFARLLNQTEEQIEEEIQ